MYSASLGLRWKLKRQSGSHRTLSRAGFPDFVFAFHDGDEIGPRMLARIAKHTGLKPGDLQICDAQPRVRPDPPTGAAASWRSVVAASRLTQALGVFTLSASDIR